MPSTSIRRSSELAAPLPAVCGWSASAGPEPAQARSLCPSRARPQSVADACRRRHGLSFTLRADAQARDQARRRAHAAERRLRRARSAARASPACRGPRSWPGSGARVLVLDRYEIGERQTSACGIPTAWLEAHGPRGLASARSSASSSSTRRTAPRATSCPGPSRPSTTASSASCSGSSATPSSRPPRSNGRTGETVHTDRGDSAAPLIVDALGWRRVLASDGGYQPPDAPLSRGLEVHPDGGARRPRDLDRPPLRARPATAGASRRATSSGSASAPSTRASTSRTPRCCSPTTSSATAVRYQGNWIPHKLRAGDRGRDLLRRRLRRPLPAADRRGHPHRASTSGSRSATSCARWSRGARTARRRCATTRSSSTRTSGSSAGCSAPSASSPACPPALQRALIRACGPQALRRLGLRPLPADRAAGVRRPRRRSRDDASASSGFAA